MYAHVPGCEMSRLVAPMGMRALREKRAELGPAVTVRVVGPDPAAVLKLTQGYTDWTSQGQPAPVLTATVELPPATGSEMKEVDKE